MIFTEDNIKYIKTGGNHSIKKDLFEEMFGKSYNHRELSNYKRATVRWKGIFIYWKQQGFIT